MTSSPNFRDCEPHHLFGRECGRSLRDPNKRVVGQSVCFADKTGGGAIGPLCADDPTTRLTATAADHFVIVANKWWDETIGGGESS